MTFTNAQVALQLSVTTNAGRGVGHSVESGILSTADRYVEWLNAQEPDRPTARKYTGVDPHAQYPG